MRFAAMVCVYLAWLGVLGLLVMWSSRPPERKAPPAPRVQTENPGR